MGRLNYILLFINKNANEYDVYLADLFDDTINLSHEDGEYSVDADSNQQDEDNSQADYSSQVTSWKY